MKNSAPKLLASTLLASTFLTLPACDVPLPEQFVLQSTSSLPEGVAYDGVTHTFFATAINGGQITRFTPLAQEIVFHADADANRSFGGAHVDPAAGGGGGVVSGDHGAHVARAACASGGSG